MYKEIMKLGNVSLYLHFEVAPTYFKIETFIGRIALCEDSGNVLRYSTYTAKLSSGFFSKEAQELAKFCSKTVEQLDSIARFAASKLQDVPKDSYDESRMFRTRFYKASYYEFRGETKDGFVMPYLELCFDTEHLITDKQSKAFDKALEFWAKRISSTVQKMGEDFLTEPRNIAIVKSILS